MTAELSRDMLPRISRESLGVPSERDRYKIKRDITIEKVNTQLLPIMRRYGIDMWIVMDREYNPDPFANEIGGRGGVRNAHIFYDNGERPEKIFIFSHGHREDLVPLLYDELIHYGYRRGAQAAPGRAGQEAEPEAHRCQHVAHDADG